MAYLVDTSILLRLANSSDVQYPVAQHAVITLHRQGETLHTAPQNLSEFRSGATRPVTDNGLGFTPAVVEHKAAMFETLFPLLPATSGIYPAWKRLVQTASVIGKQVHDARLVAICHVHSITHVLTFNIRHCTRFVGMAPGLVVMDPSKVS